MGTKEMDVPAGSRSGGTIRTVGVWALQLLMPRTVVIGALVLAAVMAGAVVAEVWILAGNPVMPLVLLILLSLVVYLRRDAARQSRAHHGR